MSKLNDEARHRIEGGTSRFVIVANPDGTFSVKDSLDKVEAWQLQKTYSHKNAMRKAISMEVIHRPQPTQAQEESFFATCSCGCGCRRKFVSVTACYCRVCNEGNCPIDKEK